jgi:hypothetical protein
MGTKAKPGTFDCYANAEDDEPMFVLLARDRVAPLVVRGWAAKREELLHSRRDDHCTVGEVLADLEQIAEARQCADAMEAWREAHR